MKCIKLARTLAIIGLLSTNMAVFANCENNSTKEILDHGSTEYITKHCDIILLEIKLTLLKMKMILYLQLLKLFAR